MSGSLHDRLQRLRRAPDAGAAPLAPLERLEREMLGGTPRDADLVPLRARLERLVAAAALKERERRRAPAPAPPIEELVQGMRVPNRHGEFFLAETAVHLESYQGGVPLTRLRATSEEAVEILGGEEGLGRFDLRTALFLDTETTGLAGGAGTAAFLIGVGFVDGDRFRVRQYFMRDYHEEAALLAALREDVERFERLVTFNGRMFDVPLLEARFRLNLRARFPLAEAAHLDLLHPARRLWKARLESCRLVALEQELLGLRRHGDIPGEAIPQLYFDYVRRRDARAMAKVFEHNRQDIVSLAALAALAGQWVEEEGRAEDPRDVLSLARVLERAGRHDRSEAAYRRAATSGPDAVRGVALLRLAGRAKRAGDRETAMALWEEAAAAGEIEALRQLAMQHEHRRRDWAAALEVVARAYRRLDAEDDSEQGARLTRLRRNFRRREERLRRKISLSRVGGSRRGPG